MSNIAAQENQILRGTNLRIGLVFNYKGKPNVIVSGSYLGQGFGGMEGGVSNWWCWKPILKDGTLGVRKEDYCNTDNFTKCNDVYEVQYIKK